MKWFDVEFVDRNGVKRYAEAHRNGWKCDDTETLDMLKRDFPLRSSTSHPYGFSALLSMQSLISSVKWTWSEEVEEQQRRDDEEGRIH